MPSSKLENDLEVGGNLTVDGTLTIDGVAVSTAVLLASGQAVDLNGESGGLILDAAAAVVLEGHSAGHAKLDVSSSTVVDVTSAGVAITGTESVSGVLTASVGVRDKGFVAVSGDGAIAIPSVDTVYYITKAGVAAMTLVDPTATTHDNLELTFIATTANAHTLDNSAGSGFNAGGSGKDVATFGGAKGDGIRIRAYQGKWYIVPGGTTNITLG